MASVARLGSATLEPVRHGAAHERDFVMIEITPLGPVLGGEAPLKLSELLGECVPAEVCDDLANAPVGTTVMSRNVTLGGGADRRVVRVDLISAPIRPIVTVSDVTTETVGREAIEEAHLRLAESEARFRDFAASGSDWFWQTDENHRFVDFSADYDIKGFRVAANVGKRREDMDILPEDRPVIARLTRDLDARKDFKDVVYRVRASSGAIIAIRAGGKPFFAADGRFLGYRGSGADVTADVERAQALTDNRLALERAESMAKIGHWRWDTSGGPPVWSRALYVIFGEDPSSDPPDLKAIFARVHPDDQRAFKAAFNDILVPGRSTEFEARLRRADGAWRQGRFVLESAAGADGGGIVVFGIVHDVTEHAVAELELSRSRAALERAEAMAKLGHWRFDVESKRFDLSRGLAVILGFRPDHLSPTIHEILDRAHPDDRSDLARDFNRALSATGSFFFGARFLAEGEAFRHVRLELVPERTADGRLASIFGVALDVTDILATEALLKRRTEKLSEANRLGRIGDWSYRLGSETVTWSDEVYWLLGFDRATLPPTPDAHMRTLHQDDHEKLLAAQAEVIRTGQVTSVDVRIHRGDGKIGDYVITTQADRNAQGQIIGFLGTIQDISERKDAERRLAKLAYTDPLTGLGNRARFQRDLDALVAEVETNGGMAALLLLDLDQFKEVNDGLGHAAGDQLLVRVAELLREEVGEGHALARLGGDEFAVIMSGVDELGAVSTASRLTRALAQPMRLDDGEVFIGTSIGIALMPRHARSVDDLLRNADLALYRAKDEGRGRFQMFEASLDAAVQARLGLTRDLRRAVEGEGLSANYQPQVSLIDGRVVGFEALLRWKHPERGNVPPSEFIPLAESSTLICDLGAWMIRETCRQVATWKRIGAPTRNVAVNVSAAQIWQGDLVEHVEKALAAAGIGPECLTLEVTEGVFLDQAKGRVRRTFETLRGIGVSLALDDFGTGYSSLGYLQQLPFEKLKIDRCFVSGITDSAAKRKLLSGIVALGKGLGMTVVGEGAETIGEVSLLRDMGCDLVQGYVFAKPMPARDALQAAAEIDGRVQGMGLRRSVRG